MIQAYDMGGIPDRVNALRARYALNDARAMEMQAVRRGDFEAIAPDLFNDQFRRPIVANAIDTAARDFAAMLAPLPTFTCSANSMLSERAKNFADKRSRIARHYVQQSDLELQMADRGADNYNTYGMLVLCAEPDFDKRSVYLRVESAIGAYPVWNSRGETTEFARVYYRDWFSILADYPHLRGLNDSHPYGVMNNNQVEVVKYVNASQAMEYLPKMGNTPLMSMANPFKECWYHVAKRPNPEDGAIKGAYDDVVWIQMARHRIQMLLMEGIDKSVRAPIIVPPDVDDVSLGPDGIIHTQGGAASVGRARLDMPNQAFGAVDQLKAEQREGAMASEARSGSTDASQITGRGLQELAGSWNTQIAIAQTVFKSAFRCVIRKAFMMDEKLFANEQKEIRGNDNGVPYSMTYVPAKDIAGDYTVDVSYGAATGMDPNRALVFLLQADGAGLVSKDFVRRSLPIDVNAAEEEKKIAVEQSRAGLVMGIAAMAQMIPQMAQSGGDPSVIILQQAKFIQLIEKGMSVEDAAAKALAPPEQPPGPSDAGTATTDASGPGGLPLPPELGGGGAPQDQPTTPQGVAGRPDLNMLMAGLSSSGQPNLQAKVSRTQLAQ
jgi:hypothetical protein